jgi:hypothetical protein
MDAELTTLARDWHDFYALVGTAAAPLVGLMFVAASIGANIFNEKHLEPMKAFVTPTVVHFFNCAAYLHSGDHSDPHLDNARAIGRRR